MPGAERATGNALIAVSLRSGSFLTLTSDEAIASVAVMLPAYGHLNA